MSTDHAAEAERLIRSGYRAVSNRHRMVKRLDRPDWAAWMAFQHTEGFPGSDIENLREGLQWVAGLGDEAAADWYRRCLSPDAITVSPQVYELVRRAPDGASTYLPLIEQKQRTTA